MKSTRIAKQATSSSIHHASIQLLIKPTVVESVKIKDVRYFPTRLDTSTSLAKLFRQQRFSVTDLATQYCELRKFYELISKTPVQPSKAMQRGIQVHARLEIEMHKDKVKIPSGLLKTAEDEWAAKFLESLAKLTALESQGQCRELYVVGAINNRLVTGYIDHLKMVDGQVQIIDSKSRTSTALPNESQQLSAYHQLLVYHQLLENMASTDYGGVFEAHDLNPDQLLNADMLGLYGRDMGQTLTLRDITNEVKQKVKGLEISKDIHVEYVRTRGRGKNKYVETIGTISYEFDKPTFNQLIEFSLGFWDNTRAPLGVPPEERIKCKYCEFAPRCSWNAALVGDTSVSSRSRTVQ